MELKLSKGYVALIDDDDWGKVKEWKWRVSLPGHTQAYGRGWRRKADGSGHEQISLHRLILDAPPGMCVDHISGNTLDNQKANLRLCTYAQNAAASASRIGTSKYKGVYWHTASKRFIARIKKDGRPIQIGKFRDEESAARAYDAKAQELFGEFARLNFPAAGISALDRPQAPQPTVDTRAIWGRSPYRGVSWHRGMECWTARITVNYKIENIGSFQNEEEAARAYDRRAIELGRSKNLNFPADYEAA